MPALLLLGLTARGQDKLLAPADSIVAAAHDIAGYFPQAARPYVRYLSLYNLPAGERARALAVLAFHLNSLSREPIITPPVVVGHLVRLNIKDYGWEPETFGKLARTDPYFHVRVKDTEGQVVAALAPWLAETADQKRQIAYLVQETKSKTPVVRADWFFSQTAIQADREAGYYDFLGLGKKQENFDALVGFDLEATRRFRDEQSSAVTRSSVALHNRRLTRFGKIGGAKWVSFDAKNNLDKRNAVRVLDDNFEFDATEQIATLPNRLHAFFLTNNKGERQDSAPDFIASDSTAPGNDRRVHAAVSCIRCHVEGIRPIDDYARKVFTGPLSLQSPDYDKALRLRQLYASDLAGSIEDDNRAYAKAVSRCNGLTTAKNAQAYALFWSRYVEADLDLGRISLEVGMPADQFLERLKLQRNIDPILAGLLANPPVPIRSEHWEEVFPLAQLVVRGYSLAEGRIRGWPTERISLRAPLE